MPAVGRPFKVVPNDTRFDTARANVEVTRAEAVDFGIPEDVEPGYAHPCKGDMDLDRLEAFLRRRGDGVRPVFVTITRASSGGRPVSREHLRGVRTIGGRNGELLILDACRFAENAGLVRQRARPAPPRGADIARDFAALAEGVTMSVTQDGLANIGARLPLRDDDLAVRHRNLRILTEGARTFGDLAGRERETTGRARPGAARDPAPHGHPEPRRRRDRGRRRRRGTHRRPARRPHRRRATRAAALHRAFRTAGGPRTPAPRGLRTRPPNLREAAT